MYNVRNGGKHKKCQLLIEGISTQTVHILEEEEIVTFRTFGCLKCQHFDAPIE